MTSSRFDLGPTSKTLTSPFYDLLNDPGFKTMEMRTLYKWNTPKCKDKRTNKENSFHTFLKMVLTKV